MSLHRSWCFTLNNFTEEEITSIGAIKCKYVIYGKELGANGTPHLQGYICFANACSLKALKKKIPRAHLEPAKGDAASNIAYCSKEGTVTERGERPQQGKRVDLDDLKKKIVAGMPVDDIVLDNPMAYHQYGRTLHKIEDITFRRKFRTEMTKGIWIVGGTGVGKSHSAYAGFNPSTHYNWKMDHGWQDGYTGQGTVIINDFRGGIAYHDLLQMVDKWPYEVPRRGREPAPFLAHTVIITSSLRPEEVYNNLAASDSLEQLMRRFTVTTLTPETSTEVVRGNTDPDLCVEKEDEDIASELLRLLSEMQQKK